MQNGQAFVVPAASNVQFCRALFSLGVVILRILYCSLGRYEMYTSVRPAAVVGGACSALRVLDVYHCIDSSMPTNF